MQKGITERFSNQILEEALERYGISRDRLEKLDGFESYIFKYTLNGTGFILRIAHSLRRSENLIKAEVDWIRYLAHNGVAVADAVLSNRGNLVEPIPDQHDGYFLATAFKELDGKPPRVSGWTSELYKRYGALMGRLHRLTKTYTPTDIHNQRPLWNSSEMNDDVFINLPADQPLARKRYKEILSHLESLSTEENSFGLIHFDAHSGNILIDETGKIKLFDFDDCNRNWFINDLAIVLFYMVTNAENPEKLAEEFLPPFLKGYRAENTLDSKWLAEIPVFLRMREIDLYAVIHRSFNVDELSGWCGQFMSGRRERIEKGQAYLNLDFSNFAEYLE